MSNEELTTQPLVKFASEGPARIYTLNRPKKLNSLNQEMVTLLKDKLSVRPLLLLPLHLSHLPDCQIARMPSSRADV